MVANLKALVETRIKPETNVFLRCRSRGKQLISFRAVRYCTLVAIVFFQMSLFIFLNGALKPFPKGFPEFKIFYFDVNVFFKLIKYKKVFN